VERPRLLPVFGIPAAVCALWTVLAGKDVNWDLLNYHYYLPYSLLHDRLAQDYFAASAQSYLNPFGYLPFYALVASGVHSVLASMALAAVHGASLGFLFLIAWRLFAHRPTAERRGLAFLATALGAASAVFCATTGTSFLEPLLAVPMLGGLVLLLDARSGGFGRRALAAGALFGAACALKYYNAIFAVAAFPLALALPQASWRERLRAGMCYAAGGVAALALLAGPWMFLMWREFGNPVFPLLNAWFQAPDVPASNMFAGRFAVHGLGQALAFPFRLLTPEWMLYAEISAPDLRFAPLVVAAAALPVTSVLRLRPAGGAQLQGRDWRLLGFFVAAFVLWLATSANARYGLIVLLLAGPCLALLAERLLPLPAARVGLLVLVIAQVAACLMASAPRWYIADRWSASWLPFAPDEQAKRAPALYLTVETLPMAAVAPFLHPESSLVNLRGQYSIRPGSPRLRALIERQGGRVRVIGRYLQLDKSGKPSPSMVEVYDTTLIRHGFHVDTSDCFAVSWRPDESDALSRVANWLAREPSRHDDALSLGSCALRRAQRDPADVLREQHVSALFDRIEQSCAGLLGGQKALTEPFGPEWLRNYPAIDARILTDHGRVILERYLVPALIDLGPLSVWERADAPLPPACAAR
jgi:hypothetical protein